MKKRECKQTYGDDKLAEEDKEKQTNSKTTKSKHLLINMASPQFRDESTRAALFSYSVTMLEGAAIFELTFDVVAS